MIPIGRARSPSCSTTDASAQGRERLVRGQHGGEQVTPLGEAALTVDDYLVTEGGIVEPEAGGWFGSRWYDVVYQAGRATVPDDLRMGVLEMLRHLWDTQRAGGSRRVGSGSSDSTANTIPGAAYLFPFRVEQLIAPHVQVGI